METADLTSIDFWESDSVDLRLNPQRRIEADGLVDFLREECSVSASVVLATSGSSGGFKFVVLPKSALLASARAVVDHCGMDEEDVSLAGLSGFHVGGLGIFARACLTGGALVDASDRKWERDGSWLVEMIHEHGVTQTSLTPTHLFDLVRHKVQAPPSLRCVLLGGGRMDPILIAEARALNWPVRVSYGMTEASSQVATAQGDEVEWLPLLSCWKTRVEKDARLAIFGDPLFSGYAMREDDSWSYRSGKTEDGWYVTGDRCEISEGQLRFLGRSDDLVKVSGELVSLSQIDSLAAAVSRDSGRDAAIVAIPEERRGHELVLVLESGAAAADGIFGQINRKLPGIEKLSRWIEVKELPRTAIGKLDRSALEGLARE